MPDKYEQISHDKIHCLRLTHKSTHSKSDSLKPPKLTLECCFQAPFIVAFHLFPAQQNRTALPIQPMDEALIFFRSFLRVGSVSWVRNRKYWIDLQPGKPSSKLRRQLKFLMAFMGCSAENSNENCRNTEIP